MCIDDGCDELLCCICAPIAAIFCCKICKDRMSQNNDNNNQITTTAFYQQPSGHIPAAGVYGPQGYGPQGYGPKDYGPQHQAQFYPGGPQPRYPPPNPMTQGNYFPPQQDYAGGVPPGYIKQQPRTHR